MPDSPQLAAAKNEATAHRFAKEQVQAVLQKVAGIVGNQNAVKGAEALRAEVERLRDENAGLRTELSIERGVIEAPCDICGGTHALEITRPRRSLWARLTGRSPSPLSS